MEGALLRPGMTTIWHDLSRHKHIIARE